MSQFMELDCETINNDEIFKILVNLDHIVCVYIDTRRVIFTDHSQVQLTKESFTDFEMSTKPVVVL